MRRLLICMMILVIPGLVFGQAETTGRVSTTVVDEAGNPVEGAKLEFISSKLQGARKGTTDSNGRYLAALLPVGSYAVTAIAPGRETATVSFRLNVGQTVPLEITLKKGEMLTEQVTVYGTATPLETTTKGENFNYDNQVEELPIQNRQIERVAEFSPNISFGPTPNTLSISGAPSYDTTVLLDGAEISDPYFGSAAPLFLEDGIEEVQVMTGGVSARYGRFQGGVINAVTKSGSNKFGGMLRAEYAKQSWNSTTPFDEEQSSELDELYQLTVGGYMMKDHLWFFAGYRTAPAAAVDGTTIGTGDAYTTSVEEDRWQLKLTGAATPNHVIAVSALDSQRDRSDAAGLPAGDSFALADREDPRETQTLSYQGVLSQSLFLDFLVTNKEVSVISGGADNGRSPFLNFFGSGFDIYNNHWWDFNDPGDRNNETAAVNLTQVISAGDWGDHTLEYGIQYVDSQTAGLNNQSPTPFNLLNYDAVFGAGPFADCTSDPCVFNMLSYYTTGLSYRWEAIPFGSLEQSIKNTAVYVNETWQLKKWRFDLGLRWDDYSSDATFPTLDMDFDSLSPRIGITYNIDENWQAQATWGKYVSRFNDNIGSTVSGVGGAPYVASIYTGPDAPNLSYAQTEALLRDDDNWDDIITFVNDPSQPVATTSASIESPYANDASFALKRALPNNTGSISFVFNRRDFKNLLTDFVGDEGTTVVTDPFGSGTMLPFDSVVWDNAGQATRTYTAFTISGDYRPSAKWSIGGNYTWSETEGNYEGEDRNQPAFGDVIGTYVRSVNQELASPTGLLDENIRHRVNVFGQYRLDFDRAGALVLGSTIRAESGRVWSMTGGLGFAPDPEGVYLNNQGTYDAYFGDRGGQNFDSWWDWNISARYQVDIAKGFAAWIKLNVINVLNNDTLTTYQTSGSVDSSGAYPVWTPNGNCTPADTPSVDCSSFGRIRNQNDYQLPRSYLVTVGFVY